MGARGAISNKYVSLLLIFVQRRLANGARRIRRSLSIANDALRTYSSTSTCGREGVEVWQHCWPLYDSRIGRAFCEPELKGSLSQKNLELLRSAVFRTSRIHFPRRPACRESHGANAENMPNSRSCFWTGARRAGSPHHCATRSSHSVIAVSPATSHRQTS